jgi:hypothetical protein
MVKLQEAQDSSHPSQRQQKFKHKLTRSFVGGINQLLELTVGITVSRAGKRVRWPGRGCDVSRKVKPLLNDCGVLLFDQGFVSRRLESENPPLLRAH